MRIAILLALLSQVGLTPWYAGYAETDGGGIRAGKQDPVFEGGNADLMGKFPPLDYITRARVGRP